MGKKRSLVHLMGGGLVHPGFPLAKQTRSNQRFVHTRQKARRTAMIFSIFRKSNTICFVLVTLKNDSPVKFVTSKLVANFQCVHSVVAAAPK